jgi:hypothetical protein
MNRQALGRREINLTLMLTLMKSVLSTTPALIDVSRPGKMRIIYPLSIFHVQTLVMVLHNVMIVHVIALLPMMFYFTALRLEKVALNTRMDMLQMLFFLILSMFQECKVLADQQQRLPEIGNANDKVTLFTTDGLIRYVNTLLAITWSLRYVSNLVLDRLSTHHQKDHPQW